MHYYNYSRFILDFIFSLILYDKILFLFNLKGEVKAMHQSLAGKLQNRVLDFSQLAKY